MKIKSRYNVPSNVAYHYRSDMPSKTSQKFKDRVALNRIVDMSTGELVIKDQQAFLDLYDENAVMHSFAQKNSAIFDATVGNDFQALNNMYANAKSEFQNLPSYVRRRFHDDVNVFLDNVVAFNAKQNEKVPSTPPATDKAENANSQAQSVADGEKSV